MQSFRRKSCFILWLFFLFLSVSVNSEAHDNINVHPYITEQAFNIWPNDTDHEIYTYLGPGYRDTGSSCDNAKQGNKITEGAKEEDDYDPYEDICVNDLSNAFYGYYHHFYNPDIPGDNNGLLDQYGALYYAKIYWQRALDNYNSNRGLSYWYLGRIAHLLGDVSVPAHVHRDPHFPGNNDSYEDHVKTNYQNWSSQHAISLGDLPGYTTLDELFYNLAQRTQYFPGDDNEGNISNTSSSWFVGWPDTTGWRIGDYDKYIALENRQKIGDRLMPLAIQYTAVLYRIFWQQIHPGEVDFTGTPRSESAPLTVSFMDLSTNNPVSWVWDFGDGSSGYERNPVHTYSTAGYYTVTLHATGDGGTWTVTKNNYINVGACANGHVRIGDVISGVTIQQAYNGMSGGDTAQTHAYVFSENLLLLNDTSVTLEGGYNCDYSSNTGFTTLNGSLAVRGGTLTVGNLIIK